jgi:hypothetical protein
MAEHRENFNQRSAERVQQLAQGPFPQKTHIESDIQMIANFLFWEVIALQRRIERIESHCGISQPPQPSS